MEFAVAYALKSARLLIVTGYGGGDFFDLDEVLAASAQAGKLEGTDVLWLDFEKDGGLSVEHMDRLAHLPAVIALHHGGATIHVLVGPTDDAHAILADVWKTAWPALPKSDT